MPFRSTPVYAPLSDNWSEKIEEEYKRRGGIKIAKLRIPTDSTRSAELAHKDFRLQIQ